jgi:predicted HTH domain antitoxin
MPLTITDDELKSMQMNEREARIEIACRLFDAGKMAFGHAAKLAGISPDEMEQEIRRRAIPRYRYTEEMFEQDVEALRRMEERSKVVK